MSSLEWLHTSNADNDIIVLAPKEKYLVSIPISSSPPPWAFGAIGALPLGTTHWRLGGLLFVSTAGALVVHCISNLMMATWTLFQ